LEKELVGDRLQEASSVVWVYKQPTNIKVCGRPQHVPSTSSSISCLRGTWEPLFQLNQEDLGIGLSPFVFRIQLELGQVDVHVVEEWNDLKFVKLRNFKNMYVKFVKLRNFKNMYVKFVKLRN